LGVLLWALLGLYVMMNQGSMSIKIRKVMIPCLLSFGLLYLSWPLLWESPFEFLKAFTHLSKYPWGGEVLFNGVFISSQSLPWYYSLWWMMITTPFFYLVLIFSGVVMFLFNLTSNHKTTSLSLTYFVLVGIWFLAPLCMTIVLESTLYDGWRHLFFIYPALLLLSGAVIDYLFHYSKRNRVVVWGVLTICLIPIVVSMMKLHPFQHVYFNALAGPKESLRANYELDYWGTSYYSLLKAILDIDSSPNIRLYMATYPGYANQYMLPKHHQKRIQIVSSIDDADYFMTHYRWHPDSYDVGKRIFKLERDNIHIASIYKLR